MLVFLIVFLSMSVVMNLMLGYGVKVLSQPVERPQIEAPVRVQAICDRGHSYAFHNKEGNCRQEMIKMDGMVMKQSYRCLCQRYVGPLPLTQYFDDQLSLES